MKRCLYVIFALVLLIAMAEVGWGQIAAWNNYSLSGITSGSLNATTNDANLNTSILSRGSGITASSLAAGYSSTGWNVATEDLAKSGGLYYQVEISASSGYKVSLSTLDARLRRTSTGPNVYIWRYSNDGSNFTDIGSTVSFTSSTSTGDVQTQIDLSGVSSLQNVINGTTITLRLYAWGATSSSASLAFGTTNTNSLAIGGTVSAVAGTPVITIDPSSRTGFSYVQGSGPSAEQSFTISGSDLTVNISITPPTDYEISTGTGGSFSATSPITLTQSGGTVSSTTIYIRLKAGLSAGNYNSETITASSTGATNKTVSCSGAVLPNAWINEIHYDNASTDANEGVEIIIENPGSFTLSDFTVTLYNGSDSTNYDSETLDNFTEGSSVADFTIFANYGTSFTGMQNGPDGIALSYQGYLIQFLSYGGSFTATAGVASGTTSTNIGVEETSSTTSTQSLQLLGNGTTYSDFTWAANLTQTWGSPNSNGSGTDQSLPVSLTSFTAKPSGNSVTLTWSTESEIENLGFMISRKSKVESGKSDNGYEVIASYLTDESLEGQGSTSAAHSYGYTDGGVQPGATYAYRLADVDYSGAVTWHKEVEVKVEVESGKMVEGFHIGALYPNPFNASFIIPLSLKESLPVEIDLYNVQGQVVKSVLRQVVAAGDHRLPVNAGDLRSGVYFVRITVGNSTRVEKIVLMK
ncbi:MAG: T9SS type A sorting domain-containing protein [archaeon]